MAITAGNNLNSIASPRKQTLETNYLDLASDAGKGWAQQYVPDLMEQEAEVFGPRTISGFLSQVGAEESMTADQVVWSEQGRLHLSYLGDIDATNTITIQSDIDGNNYAEGGISVAHGIRLNDTVIVSNANGVVKGLVTGFAGTNDCDVTVKTYDGSTIATATANKGTTILVYGSEYVKGVGYNQKGGTHSDSHQANEPVFKSFTNKPIIM